MARVLVVYASKYGSTKEVADAVAKTLSESGLDVDVRPAGEVKEVAEYSAIVIGTALYFFMLRRDAKRFLARHKKALAVKPCALFAMGPWNDTPEEMETARKPVDKYLTTNAWFKPVAVEVFGGRHDPTQPRGFDNNPGMRQMPASDARDWGKIRAWAQTLPKALGLES